MFKNKYEHDYPSVTELLPKRDFYISAERLNELAREGTLNHDMVELFFETGNTFDEPYLVEFKAFYEENRKELGDIVMCGKPLYSDIHKFCGTPDLIFQNGIVDLKRSFYRKEYHALQLAGYSILLAENGIINTHSWYIIYHDKVKFRMRNVYNDEAETIFAKLLQSYWNAKDVESYLKPKDRKSEPRAASQS